MMKFLIITTEQIRLLYDMEDPDTVLEKPCPQAHAEVVEWQDSSWKGTITIKRELWFLEISDISELKEIADRWVLMFSGNDLGIEPIAEAAGCPILEIYNDYRE